MEDAIGSGETIENVYYVTYVICLLVAALERDNMKIINGK